jgi:hypothetical protein
MKSSIHLFYGIIIGILIVACTGQSTSETASSSTGQSIDETVSQSNTQTPTKSSDEDTDEANSLNKAERLAKSFVSSYKKSGVPTPKLVAKALSTAQKSNSLENWQKVASLANSYGNSVDVIKDHYYQYYLGERTYRSSYLSKAAAYEKIQNKHLQIRNDAYLKMSGILKSQGRLAEALSYAITAVQLTGSDINSQGVSQIESIIEFNP